jgi:hypothetical protein
MSIATLKKKSANKYNNLSVGKPQFSLNGSLRLQGYVGQTMLSRSLPRTLMNGNVVRGHGGLYGGYVQAPIVKEGTGLGTNELNDPRVVKSSVLDTNGMIMTKYRWIRRPAPITSVKPDTTMNVGSQGQYIDILQRVTLTDQCSQDPIVGGKSKNCDDCNNGIMRPSYTDLGWKSRKHVITKDDKVMSQGAYLMQLDRACGLMDSGAVLSEVTQKTTQGIPFSCGRGSYIPIQELGSVLSGSIIGTQTIVYIP